MTAPPIAPERRRRMHDVMAAHVERGEIPGAVTVLARAGDAHVDALGAAALDARRPMRRDTIFRISSMTKPIAAAASLSLVEEGRLELDEPVDRLLPELAGRRVLKRLDGRLEETVPARRPITVRDLLTSRMGFGLVMAPGRHPVVDAAHRLGLGMGPPKPQPPHAPDEWLRRFATLPLMHQPGEGWMYQTSFCVLGVLLARAARRPLETVLRERILDPLGMSDTGFSVPAEKLDRLAPCYVAGPDGLEPFDGVEDSQWSRPPALPNADGGLVSTVDDYLAFARMLLGHGSHRGASVLSPRSVEAMTTDQLRPEQRAMGRDFLGDDRGWGFGLATVAPRDGAPARYGWDGGLGTSWSSSPGDGTIAILMTQRLPPAWEMLGDFWAAAHGRTDE
jgi:CubicO group peptidase (beta-lactamase class C family)